MNGLTIATKWSCGRPTLIQIGKRGSSNVIASASRTRVRSVWSSVSPLEETAATTTTRRTVWTDEELTTTVGCRLTHCPSMKCSLKKMESLIRAGVFHHPSMQPNVYSPEIHTPTSDPSIHHQPHPFPFSQFL